METSGNLLPDCDIVTKLVNLLNLQLWQIYNPVKRQIILLHFSVMKRYIENISDMLSLI
jgi:hypothetical protein